MRPIEEQVLVERPVEDVFAQVADVRSHPGWRSGLRDARPLDDGPPRRGARHVEVRRVAGRTVETLSETVAVVPPHAIAHRALAGPVREEAVVLLHPVAGGTRVTVRIEASPAARGRALGPLLVLRRPLLVRRLRGDLQRLRGLFERG